MQRLLEAKGRERIALSGHLRSRVSKVAAQDKKAGVTHQRERQGQEKECEEGSGDGSQELREPISGVARDA